MRRYPLGSACSTRGQGLWSFVDASEIDCPIERQANAPTQDQSPADQSRPDKAAATRSNGRTSSPRSEKRNEGPEWRVTPAPDGRGAPAKIPRGRGWWWFVAIVAALSAINYFGASSSLGPESRIRVPYLPTFVKQVDAGNVKSISSRGDSIQGEFKRPVTYPPKPDKDAKKSARFTTHVPAFADTSALTQLLARHGVTVDAEPIDTGAPLWEKLLVGLLPTLLLVSLLLWLLRRSARAAGGSGGVFGMGRAKARRAEPGQVQVTFDDVAGIDEAKAELAEIVDFLRNPDRYRRLGGRLPRGVLLTGPPGTGKTLLARAVAGQAKVPFFTMSASEFIEMIVGVGASRVRDLFEQAKTAAPAIIFIDELDAIGRRRGGPGIAGGGHEEREQTLNQILTEMDGFDSTTGIVVLGATNRPDVLDAALLRPGRFDRRVHVAPPDKNGRREILKVHTRALPLADDVDLERLAATTPGMVGADLANLANEAALTAARRDHDQIEMRDFTDSLERIVLGAARKLLMSEDDRRRTAYHEAGHALVGMLTAHADPVRKVSIIPRGRALGVTFSAPDADRLNYDEDALVARIRVALAGRAAEELVFGNHTTGAESDLEQVTAIARQMVGRWGMSDAIGPLVAFPAGEDAFVPGTQIASADTQRLVDEEARRIAIDAQNRVSDLVAEHRDQLDALASALLEHETLDQHDAYEAAGVPLDARSASPLPQG
jgi:cell division protease FtsH